MEEEKKSKSDVRLINLSTFESPKFTDVKPNGKQYILNGRNNINYQYVIDCYKKSPTNSAIIDSYANFIYGKGITANYNSINASEFAIVLALLKKEDVKKICKDWAMFHESSFEVILGKTGNKIVEINHLPKQKVVPNEVDENGKITKYWYCYNWSNTHKYPPVDIPVFEQGTKTKKTIMVVREYNFDEFYFSRPSYYSGLNYAELESAISIYCINHINNGLSAGHVVNFNGGDPDEDVKNKIEKRVNEKFGGTGNAGKIVISFNQSKEEATTVDTIQVSDAHQQYQFLSEEARRQLMVAHKVTSPILFGIKDNTGFGNNADEMETAFDELMMNVIQPLQEPLLDSFMYVLGQNGITLELEFAPLRPKKQVEETQPTQTALSVCFSSHSENDDKIANGLIELGEDEDLENWDLVSEKEVDYDEELFLNLSTSTGTAIPNAKSEQDSDIYKVRYQYAPLKVSENSREFCKKMVNASKVYRKEDIIRMDNQIVNEGWGPEGADTYSIWLYKGGGDCHHKWFRKIYVKKGANVDVNSPLAEIISTSEARRKGFNPQANDSKVAIEPRNMKNNGFLKPR